MKTTLAVGIFLILLTFVISCKKKETTPPVDKPDDMVLTGDSILHIIKKNSVIIATYTYNANHTVKSIMENYDDGNYCSTTDFVYNTEGMVVRINYTYSDTIYNSHDDCIYNSHNLISYIHNNSGGVQDYSVALEYDTLNRLTHYYYYYGGGIFGTNYIYDSNNNIVKEYDSFDLVKDTTYYTYDNNTSYKIKGALRLTEPEISVNNILQKIHNDQNGGVKPFDSYNAVYEYNSLGLPIKETRTYLNSNVVVYDFEYY
jgi:hypothetical protein